MYGVICSHRLWNDIEKAVLFTSDLIILKVIANEVDIIAEFEKVNRIPIKHLIIDLTAIRDPRKLINAVQTFRTKNNETRITIIAPSYKPGNVIIHSLVTMGIYNIVSFNADTSSDQIQENIYRRLCSPATFTDASRWYISSEASISEGINKYSNGNEGINNWNNNNEGTNKWSNGNESLNYRSNSNEGTNNWNNNNQDINKYSNGNEGTNNWNNNNQGINNRSNGNESLNYRSNSNEGINNWNNNNQGINNRSNGNESLNYRNNSNEGINNWNNNNQGINNRSNGNEGINNWKNNNEGTNKWSNGNESLNYRSNSNEGVNRWNNNDEDLNTRSNNNEGINRRNNNNESINKWSNSNEDLYNRSNNNEGINSWNNNNESINRWSNNDESINKWSNSNEDLNNRGNNNESINRWSNNDENINNWSNSNEDLNNRSNNNEGVNRWSNNNEDLNNRSNSNNDEGLINWSNSDEGLNNKSNSNEGLIKWNNVNEGINNRSNSNEGLIKWSNSKINNPNEKESIYKDRIIGSTVIAVGGTDRGVGSTHISLSIASYLKSLGYKVGLLELAEKPVFQYIEEYMNGWREENNSFFSINDIDFYNSGCFKMGELSKVGYKYLILDIGRLKVPSNNFEYIPNKYYGEMLRANLQVIVCGGGVWQLPQLKIYLNDDIDNWCTVFNLPYQRGAFYSDLANMGYLMPYQEDPFVLDEEGRDIISKIVDPVIPKGVPQKKGFLKLISK
jgi:hypothetical protein